MSLSKGNLIVSQVERISGPLRGCNVVNMGKMLMALGVERVRTRNGSAYRGGSGMIVICSVALPTKKYRYFLSSKALLIRVVLPVCLRPTMMVMAALVFYLKFRNGHFRNSGFAIELIKFAKI